MPVQLPVQYKSIVDFLFDSKDFVVVVVSSTCSIPFEAAFFKF